MKKIDNTEFVEVWQLAESRCEVAQHFGITEQQASAKANYLRCHYDVPLRKFRRQGNDWQRLRGYAEVLLADNHAGRKARARVRQRGLGKSDA